MNPREPESRRVRGARPPTPRSPGQPAEPPSSEPWSPEVGPARASARPNTAALTAALARARTGDEDGFRDLYRAIQPGLLRYLRALVGADAEDVASEAWVQIARDLGSFSGDGDAFRGWAATVARHRALDHLRYERRRPTVPAPVSDLVDLPGADDTADRALEVLSTDQAIALILTLPQEQAEAILLRVVLGLDAAAAGRVLGKRAGAVRTATHRGLRRLAEKLDPDYRAPDADEPSQ